MPIGTSKIGVLGAGTVPGGTQTFNASGTFTVPPGVTKVNITGKGGTGTAGNSGNPGNAGNSGNGGAGGGGTASYRNWSCSWDIVRGFGGGAFRGAGITINNPFAQGGSMNCNYAQTRSSANAGQAGCAGTAGQAGQAGNAGSAGNASTGLCKTFPGGAAGQAGAAGNAGTGGAAGQGGSGGTNGGSLTAGQPGAGGCGGGSGGTGNNFTRAQGQGNPCPCVPQYITGGRGGGGAGSVNPGQSGLSGGAYIPSANFTLPLGGTGQLTGPNLPATIGTANSDGGYSGPCGGNPGSKRGFSVVVDGVPCTNNLPNARTSVCQFNPAPLRPSLYRAGGGGMSAGFLGYPGNQTPPGPGGSTSPTSVFYSSGGGGGGGGRGGAGGAGGTQVAGNPGSAATPQTFNCVSVTPGSPYPIVVGGPSGGQVVISWNPQ